MEENLQTGAAQFVRDNLSHDDVQAYLTKDHVRHDEVVGQVTQIIEDHFGETSGPRLGLDETSEQEIRRELYNDPREIDAQIKDILHNNDPKWSKPYWDPNHPLHNEAVERMSMLSDAKYDGKVHEKETWPIKTRTAVNLKQSGNENTY